MMLATEGLRVALATTHLPLKMSARRLLKTSLTPHPRNSAAGFNSAIWHSSAAYFSLRFKPSRRRKRPFGYGRNHYDYPVLNQLRAKGFHLTGPLPADTLFTPNI